MDINEITYAINGAVYEVNRILGSGFLEKVYENALLKELENRGINVERQVPIKVFYKDSCVGDYFADLLVEDSIVVELKTVDKIEKNSRSTIAELFKSHRVAGWPADQL